jgi:hypothetical protein
MAPSGFAPAEPPSWSARTAHTHTVTESEWAAGDADGKRGAISGDGA